MAPKTKPQSIARYATCCFAVLFFCAAMAVIAPAQTFTTLVNFDGTNGMNPETPLVQGKNGDLYGTTALGGTHQVGMSYGGTIFKVTTAGTFSVVYNFCALASCADGSSPLGALVQAGNGDFYGTTFNGGASNYGVFYKITSAGAQTVLQSFDYDDGWGPRGALAVGKNGDFYGLATGGGSSDDTGTIYDVTPSGTITPLFLFGFGEYPDNGAVALVLANNGNFYGTTEASGAPDFAGTVFEMSPSGTFSILHTLNGTTDGGNPLSGLLLGPDGNLYGTAPSGGANNDGVVFKMTPAGAYSVVYNFTGTDGSYPTAALTLGSDGNLYGTTTAGGANGYGTVFMMTLAGTVTDVYDFTSSTGAGSIAGVMQATNGTFYGATFNGGSSGDGIVFSLNTGLAPFVSLTATAGKEGVPVGILGQGFNSSSVVQFGDGARATTVTLSGTTYLTATVPPGALTGTVTVTTGSSVLTSNRTFKVTPTFASFTPPSGPVGTVVTINGTGLLQTDKVTFNGKAAVFTVISDTEITATVPTGATTGKIVVITAGGSVSNPTSFVVN